MGQTSVPPFEFKDCALISIATGRRAGTLVELRDALHGAPRDAVYFHFWGGLLEARFEKREYNNDFATWVRHALHDPVLAERLAMVDPVEYPDVNDLRLRLIDLIDDRLDEGDGPARVWAERPFELIRSQIIVFATHRTAETPAELAALLAQQSPSCIFYHFIDARRRVPDGRDDFRVWLGDFNEGHERLCARLAALDPYVTTLTELRARLVALFEEELAGA